MLDASGLGMPTSEILAGLTEIANRGIQIAAAWHLVLAIAIIALAAGWRPATRTARVLVVGPLVSVAIFAFAFGNPFNALVFTGASVVLVALAVGGGAYQRISSGSLPAAWLGVAMIAYGWVYPHFLEAPLFAYVYSAPVGLVPCPSLAIVIGLTLLGGGLGSRSFSLALATLGLVYGLFGVLRLGVHLDVGLIAGALALGAIAVRSPRARASTFAQI
jgi:hypothetical protein